MYVRTYVDCEQSFKGALSRGFRRYLAQTILEISGSQLNPLRTVSLNI